MRMRKLLSILCISLCSLSFEAAAQNNPNPGVLEDLKPLSQRTKADILNIYLERCVNDNLSNLKAKDQEFYCLCTLANMEETLSENDLRQLDNDDQSGLVIRQVIAAQSMAPCTSFHFKETIFDDCKRSPKMRENVNSNAICGCQSDLFSRFIEQNATDILIRQINLEPENLNVMQILKNDPFLALQKQEYYKKCIFRYR